MRLPEHIKLLIMPCFGGDNTAVAISETRVVLRAQEISNAVSILQLQLAQRNDPVHSRAQTIAGEEAQSIAYVDDGVPLLRSYKAPTSGVSAQDLQSPRLAQEKRQRPEISMLVVSHSNINRLLFWVAEHGKSSQRWAVVAVKVLHRVAEVECGIETSQNDHDGLVGGVDEAFEEAVVGRHY